MANVTFDAHPYKLNYQTLKDRFNSDKKQTTKRQNSMKIRYYKTIQAKSACNERWDLGAVINLGHHIA